MRVIHHSNACFSLFHNNLHILTDPWIESHSVAGGWTQFPPVKIKTLDLPKIDYIFISHIHSDHCEIETMKQLDRNIPIIIMERNPNFLKKYLETLDFKKIITCNQEVKTKVNDDFSVELFGESFGHICSNIIDSSIIFEFKDGPVVLNCNDNKPSQDLCRYIKDNYNTIDVAFIPCGGGSGYPAMYENISVEDKLKISNSVVENYAKVFTEAVDILLPKITIPVAGGFAIRGPHAETVNWVQCRRFNLNEVVEYYTQHTKAFGQNIKIIPMQPGLELDTDQAKLVNGQYHIWTHADLKVYFKKLSNEKILSKVVTQEPMKNLGRLVLLARQQLWLKQVKNNIKPAYFIVLNIPTCKNLIELDLANNSCIEISREKQLRQPFLKMTLDQDTLLDWLLGFEDFNMLDSGHRILFMREPINQYVQEAYYLMSLLRLA